MCLCRKNVPMKKYIHNKNVHIHFLEGFHSMIGLKLLNNKD